MSDISQYFPLLPSTQVVNYQTLQKRLLCSLFPSLSLCSQLAVTPTLVILCPVCVNCRLLCKTIDFYNCKISGKSRCGSRIWSREGGGAQLLRPKVADVVKRSRASEVSNLRPGSRACLRALEAFGFLMLKYAFSHILETLFLSFLTSILTLKVDKNRALEFTSINLRHSYILHLFFNLHEKVMLKLNDLKYGGRSETKKRFYDKGGEK